MYTYILWKSECIPVSFNKAGKSHLRLYIAEYDIFVPANRMMKSSIFLLPKCEAALVEVTQSKEPKSSLRL